MYNFPTKALYTIKKKKKKKAIVTEGKYLVITHQRLLVHWLLFFLLASKWKGFADTLCVIRAHCIQSAFRSMQTDGWICLHRDLF